MDKDNKNTQNGQPSEEQKTYADTQGKFRHIPKDQLKQILKNHVKWIKSMGKEGKRADLHLSNLKGLKIKNAVLAFANFQQSDLFEANLQNAIMIRANLRESYLCQANMRMANLSKVNLEGAEIIGSNLSSSNLTEANLKNCNCRGTDFEGAILVNTNLQGADLMSAFLEEADFRGANLKKAKNLSIEQLEGVKTLFQAKLDPKLMEQVKATNQKLFKEPQKEKERKV